SMLHPNRMVLDVNGQVAQIEAAFRVSLAVYPHPSGTRTFYAPVSEPVVEAGLPILYIAGLTDFEPGRPMSLHQLPAGVHSNATGSGPGGDFIGNDFRAAYTPGVTLDGSGQIVGLVELGPYNMSDV